MEHVFSQKSSMVAYNYHDNIHGKRYLLLACLVTNTLAIRSVLAGWLLLSPPHKMLFTVVLDISNILIHSSMFVHVTLELGAYFSCNFQRGPSPIQKAKAISSVTNLLPCTLFTHSWLLDPQLKTMIYFRNPTWMIQRHCWNIHGRILNTQKSTSPHAWRP